MKQKLFIRKSFDKGEKVNPVKLIPHKSNLSHLAKSPKSFYPGQITSKPSIMSQSLLFPDKKLNKIQENINQSDLKRTSYSRQSSILSIDDLLLLGKDLFTEQVQVKNSSKTPNIMRSTVNTFIELKGTKTGTKKESKSRPKSNRKFLKVVNINNFRCIRPVTVSKNLQIKNRIDTLSPWVDSNF